MKSILLSFNEGEAMRQQNIICNNVIPFINSEVLPLWEDLTIGELTKPLFEDLITGGATVLQLYSKSTESQLTKAGIKGARLRENLKAGSMQVFEGIIESVSRLQMVHGREILNYVSFEKSKAILNDADRAQIEEKNKLYVESEPGQKLRELHLHTVSEVNKLLGAMQTKGKLYGFMPMHYFGQLFHVDSEGERISFKPANLDYDTLA